MGDKLVVADTLCMICGRREDSARKNGEERNSKEGGGCDKMKHVQRVIGRMESSKQQVQC